MKILLAHNFYRSSAPSGEDMVYRNERALLEQSDVFTVIPYERHNDDIDESTLAKQLRLAINGIWSRRTYREVSDLIRCERPDLAHFHNTFPQISPSAYAACRDNGVPVVQTLHNFRYVCPQAMLLRNGSPCEDCLGGSVLPALRHRCYRGSLAATLAQVCTITFNRWRGSYGLVNRYLALTRVASRKLMDGGFPARKLTVKPNFLNDPPLPGNGEGGYAVFVGRLSPEKGLRTLLAAWRLNPALPLKIVGTGPLEEELRRTALAERLPVEFLGYRGRADIYDIVGRAELMVVPSEWYEGFPMVVLEALACGTPVVASRLGSLSEVVVEGITGVHFTAGDPVDLAGAVNQLRSDRLVLSAMRQRCRARFDQNYTADHARTALIEIYTAVCQEYRRKSTR